jgi:DNA polymerase
VCLGATAAKALLGPAFRLTEQRGQLIPSPLAPMVMATIHPSAPLRAPDEARHWVAAQLVADLRKIARLLSRAVEGK